MKSGVSHSTEDEFRYWILPDKPMSRPIVSKGIQGAFQEWDQEATKTQLEQIRGYLGVATQGKWMETNGRFYFELEQDWEMFKTMCIMGWQ